MVDNEQILADALSAETSDSLGDVLRKARAAHDLTLDQLATELRIEARQLQALEENRFEQIGVPVFVKGYLRQYGQRLGLDHGDLLALYYKQTKLAEVAIQPSKTIKLRDERQITLWIVALAILLALAAGLAYYWYNGNGLFGFGSTGEVTSVPPAAVSGDANVRSEPESAPVSRSPAAPPLPARPAADRTGVTDGAAVPAPDSQAGEVVPPLAATSPPPSAPASSEPGDSPPLSAPAAGSIAIELTFDEESWAEVTDAAGTRLFYGLGAAGQRVSVQGEPPFAVVIGNAPAVHFVVDGAPYPIPQEGRQGKLARFSIDSTEE